MEQNHSTVHNLTYFGVKVARLFRAWPW